MRKSFRKGIILFLGLFFGFSVMFGAGISYYLERDHQAKMQENMDNNIQSLENAPEPQLQERVNILVMGVDFLHLSETEGQRGTRTDTIMLFSFDPKTETSFLLSIPRDSRVNVPGHGLDKINHAHSYGGTDLAIQTISDLLDIPIHHYVKVDYNAVTQLVDAVGGVEVDIPQNMYYGALQINFKSGVQTLNGEQAVKYLRYRSYKTGDLGRIDVQQGFVKLLMEKVLSPSMVSNVPTYINILEENVETNMSKKQMLELSSAMLGKFDPSKMERVMLPGVPEYIGNVSYFLVDDSAKYELIDRLMSGIVELPEEETETTEGTQVKSGTQS